MPKGRGFHTLDKDLGRISHTEAAQRYALRPVWQLGLAMLALVAGLILVLGLGGGPSVFAGVAAGLIVAGWLGLAIGANDVANSLGPAVGAKAIGLVPGLCLVALAEIAGAGLAGDAVTHRLASGILRAAASSDLTSLQLVMLSALIGAAAWITTATGAGLPVSTSHSIVGGVAGAGVVALGIGAVNWSALALIASSWVLTPLVSGVLAAAVVIFLRRRVLDAPDRAAGARRWLPVLVGLMTLLFAAYLCLLAWPEIGAAGSLAVAVLAGLAGGGVTRRMLEAELARADGDPGSKRLLRPPLLVAVTITGFAHGANDVGNIAGPLSVIIAGDPAGALARMPLVLLLLAGLAIATGTVLFGRRLVVMVGSGITRLNADRAFCVALATGATVLCASAFGLPVSTTHIAVGGIFGVGFAREWLDRRSDRMRHPLPAEETRRRMLIRRSHVATITAAWVVTVPAAAAIGGLSCLMILWAAGL